MKLPWIKRLARSSLNFGRETDCPTERPCVPVTCNRLEYSNMEYARALVLKCRRVSWKKARSHPVHFVTVPWKT
jgi:hypothetical protein